MKFDFNGFSKANGRVPIGEGDEDWPEVLKALCEIGYDGWATSEVSGPPRRVNSGECELAGIAARMKRVLGVGGSSSFQGLRALGINPRRAIEQIVEYKNDREMLHNKQRRTTDARSSRIG